MNKLADEEQTIAKPGIISRKQIIAAVFFTALAIFLATTVPTVEIAWVSAILVLTIYLFAFEILFYLTGKIFSLYIFTFIMCLFALGYSHLNLHLPIFKVHF